MTSGLREILHELSNSSQLSELPFKVRQRIHGICADFLGGPWRSIPVSDIKIKHLTGGTSNVLFLCALSTSKPPGDGAAENGDTNQVGIHDSSTPTEVLLRIYFNPNTESHVLEESVVFTLLAERKLGPKLYGVFAEGRLEEYIHSRALLTQEIRLPGVSAKVSRILAQLHLLTVPISKRPSFLRESMIKWMDQLQSIYESKKQDSVVVMRSSGLEKSLSLGELESEVALVLQCIEQSPSPVVFCHNDFQEGNVLVRKSDNGLETADFSVIDYEYASYNYRAFDIANHFCEWIFDFRSNSDHPFFECTPETFPTDDQQVIFAQNYLDEISKNAADSEGCSPSPVLSGDVRDLLDEVMPFVPVSHFVWGLWALLLAETSPVQFGYTEYARCRLQIYYDLKSDLLKLLPPQCHAGASVNTVCNRN